MSEPYALVTTEPLDEETVRAAVADEHHGAVLVFHGVVRDHDGGQSVTGLDYSAHPEAEAILRACLAAGTSSEASPEGCAGLRFAAAHRIGELRVGDTALIAAVSSAHRPEAFAALAAMVTKIKAEVPIWKRQHFTAGASEWVGL